VGKLHYNPYQPPGKPRTTYGLTTTELAESGRIVGKFDKENRLTGLEDYLDYLHTVGWGGYTRGHGLGNNDVYAAPSPIPQEHYVDTWVADRSIHYMREHMAERKEKPFFMWASFPKPHSAFDPPYPYNRMYDPREMPDPVGSLEMMRERGFDDRVQRHYEHMWDLLSPQAMRVIKAYYYGLISHQDAQVGKMLDFLEENGLREDTIVIYTADHGEMLGDFGQYFKTILYNGAVKVPLLISYPRKLPKGKVTEQPAGLQDLLPTMLSLAGQPLEQRVDGIDLTPAMVQDQPLRKYYVAESGNEPKPQYMVANGDWKYIYSKRGAFEELYDQRSDPAELDNLVASPDPEIQRIKSEMRSYLTDWCRDYGLPDMLRNGELQSVEHVPDFRRPERGNTFGRRLY
jgi:arylsulfatase A-like enzyme